MFHFCFNDCIIPLNGEEHALVECLKNTLKEYNEIKTKFPGDVDGIITDTDPIKLYLNNVAQTTLANCIEGLDRSYKVIAYRNFGKYPVSNNFLLQNEDDLIEGGYYVALNNIQCDGLNVKIVSDNNGILFSLPIHDDIKKDSLSIVNLAKDTFLVNNLYGAKLNTDHINGIIASSLNAKLGKYEKLLALIENGIVSEKFEKGFKKAPGIVQDSIIEHFESAINRKGITRFFADKALIKDVTPDKETKTKVYELRIFAPVAHRIYFYEDNNRTYLALSEQKPQPKVQSVQIKNANAIINELVATS